MPARSRASTPSTTAGSGRAPASTQLRGWWPAGPALLPLTLGFAVADYRARGHAVAGRYVVVRSGVLNRVTVAVQHRAVVGLSFEQTTFQRRGGRMTVTFATAAGTYKARDVGFGQGIALMRAVRPDLAGMLDEAVEAQSGG